MRHPQACEALLSLSSVLRLSKEAVYFPEHAVVACINSENGTGKSPSEGTEFIFDYDETLSDKA